MANISGLNGVGPQMHPLEYMSWNDRVWTSRQADFLAENGYSHPDMLIDDRAERGVILSSLNQGVARWPGDTDGVTDRDYLVVAYRFPEAAFESFPGSRALIAEAMQEVSDNYMNGCIQWVDDTATQGSYFTTKVICNKHPKKIRRY
jgi:hypothetical protein